jgi:hypothetical protein
MKLKLSDGWRYGKTKDAVAKIHPSLIPFEQLPAPEQAKDLMAIVRALA